MIGGKKGMENPSGPPAPSHKYNNLELFKILDCPSGFRKKIIIPSSGKFGNVRNTLILLTKVQAQDITNLPIFTFQARIFQERQALGR
jgi:hypothetical protein